MSVGAETVEYDADEDIVYVRLVEAVVSWTKALDDLRLIDYAHDGRMVGVEILSASSGVALSGVPHRDRIEALVARSGHRIRILA